MATVQKQSSSCSKRFKSYTVEGPNRLTSFGEVETGLGSGALRLSSVSSTVVMLRSPFRLCSSPVQSSSFFYLPSLSLHSHICLARPIGCCCLTDGYVRSVTPDSPSWHLQKASLPANLTTQPTNHHNQTQSLHQPATPAVMAKTPHQPIPRKRKRAHDDAVATMPLRRSRRVAFRDSFRFNDLPQELRDEV